MRGSGASSRRGPRASRSGRRCGRRKTAAPAPGKAGAPFHFVLEPVDARGRRWWYFSRARTARLPKSRCAVITAIAMSCSWSGAMKPITLARRWNLRIAMGRAHAAADAHVVADQLSSSTMAMKPRSLANTSTSLPAAPRTRSELARQVVGLAVDRFCFLAAAGDLFVHARSRKRRGVRQQAFRSTRAACAHAVAMQRRLLRVGAPPPRCG